MARRSATSSTEPSASSQSRQRKADAVVDEAIDVGHGRSDPLVIHAKMLRLELLKVEADLERELETWVPNCTKSGLDVHWVADLGVPPAIGRIGSPRRTASPASEPMDTYDALGRWSACVGVEEE